MVDSGAYVYFPMFCVLFKVPALEHKNTLTFLNNFIIHTTQFLNKFSNVCEEVIMKVN